MSELAQPPAPAKATLQASQPLAKYHEQLGPWFSQVRDAIMSSTLKENMGAVVTDPITVTAGADGDLTGQITVPASFNPLLVLFRAEILDASKRPTGVFVGGSATWTSSLKDGGASISVTRAPGLTEDASYAVTVVAIPG